MPTKINLPSICTFPAVPTGAFYKYKANDSIIYFKVNDKLAIWFSLNNNGEIKETNYINVDNESTLSLEVSDVYYTTEINLKK